MDPVLISTIALVLGAVACFTSVAHLVWVALPPERPKEADETSQSWSYNTSPS